MKAALDVGHGIDWVAPNGFLGLGRRLQNVAFENSSHGQLCFQHGKSHSNAVMRALAKWHPGISVKIMSTLKLVPRLLKITDGHLVLHINLRMP